MQKLKYFKLITLIIFISCSVHKKFIGYPNTANISDIIKPLDSKDDILRKIGEPSFEKDNKWFYVRINGKEGNLVSFIPENKIIAEISFENHVVKNIKIHQCQIKNNVNEFQIDTKNVDAYKNPFTSDA